MPCKDGKKIQNGLKELQELYTKQTHEINELRLQISRMQQILLQMMRDYQPG